MGEVSMMWGFFAAVSFIVWAITSNTRGVKMAHIKSEMQARLLEKLSNGHELADYLKSEAGQRLLESATTEQTSPFRKILGSIQAGLVFTLPTFAQTPRSPMIYCRSRTITSCVCGSRRWTVPESELSPSQVPVSQDAGNGLQLKSDLARVMERLDPRSRELLWLAYVEGSSHKEIAEAIGIKAQSVRTVLFRARERMMALLRAEGIAPGSLLPEDEGT